MGGAPPAQLGQIFMQRAGKKEREIFKTIDMGDMYPGDLLITRTSGGAGWGNPLNRDPERVRLNVRDGFLSIQRARDVYGVVITQKEEGNPETVEVDEEATRKLRCNRGASRL
jgi:N-methylhydantoinase B